MLLLFFIFLVSRGLRVPTCSAEQDGTTFVFQRTIHEPLDQGHYRVLPSYSAYHHPLKVRYLSNTQKKSSPGQ